MPTPMPPTPAPPTPAPPTPAPPTSASYVHGHDDACACTESHGVSCVPNEGRWVCCNRDCCDTDVGKLQRSAEVHVLNDSPPRSAHAVFWQLVVVVAHRGPRQGVTLPAMSLVAECYMCMSLPRTANASSGARDLYFTP